MPVRYDESIIQAFAQRLYGRATTITVLYGLFGFLVAGIAGAVWQNDTSLAFAVALIGALLGAAYGQSLAFTLKLQAQTALCQAQIEQHTRHCASMLTALHERGLGPPGQPGHNSGL